jgi:hypothetical protein
MATNEASSSGDRVRSLLKESRSSPRDTATNDNTTTNAGTKRHRFTEPQKFVPIAFVVFTIFLQWYLYVFFHCIPLIRLGNHEVDHAKTRGSIELVVFHYFLTFLLICYVQSILVHPGEIPDNDPQWEYIPRDGTSPSDWVGMSVQEMKKTGERRHCKWCGKYKPDRCHHCRVCKTCILKMDHHCPWIYNCVGFYNHKYFLLLLLYIVLSTHMIVWTMLESVLKCIDDPSVPFLTMFATFFGETLAFFFATLFTVFFGFHIWLVLTAMTTIEFCEKSLTKKDGQGKKAYDACVYDFGVLGNMRSILGENPFLWFFPCGMPRGDGLTFIMDETRLTNDMEIGNKGVRRKGHQAAQRSTHRAPRLYGSAGGRSTSPSITG